MVGWENLTPLGDDRDEIRPILCIIKPGQAGIAAIMRWLACISHVNILTVNISPVQNKTQNGL